MPSFTNTHTDVSQKNNSIQHSQNIYTREHKLSIHLNSQNFNNFDPHQISRCLSLLKLICSTESTSFTRRSGKREASSQIRSATSTSFTQCSSKLLPSLPLLKKKNSIFRLEEPKKRSPLSPQPESPQKPSWEFVSFPLKPFVLTVLRSIRPRSHSPSPPVLQKFGAITLHHHSPPFLQVPRTHPSKRRKTTTALHAIVMNAEKRSAS